MLLLSIMIFLVQIYLWPYHNFFEFFWDKFDNVNNGAAILYRLTTCLCPCIIVFAGNAQCLFLTWLSLFSSETFVDSKVHVTNGGSRCSWMRAKGIVKDPLIIKKEVKTSKYCAAVKVKKSKKTAFLKDEVVEKVIFCCALQKMLPYRCRICYLLLLKRSKFWKVSFTFKKSFLQYGHLHCARLCHLRLNAGINLYD